MVLHLHISWLLSLTCSLLYDDIIHNNPLSTLLTHRHTNIGTHRNRRCKSALATAVPHDPEKPLRKQQGHTQHQERLSDGNINYADLTTKLLQISVEFGMNTTESISSRTPLPGGLMTSGSWLIPAIHTSPQVPLQNVIFIKQKKRGQCGTSTLRCHNPDSAQLGLNQIVLVQVHPEDSASYSTTKLPLFQTTKALWAPPTLWDFSIPKIALRQKKFASGCWC